MEMSGRTATLPLHGWPTPLDDRSRFETADAFCRLWEAWVRKGTSRAEKASARGRWHCARAHTGVSMGQTGRQMRARTKGAVARRPRTARTSTTPPRGARLRYAFDRSMSRGTIALIGWLA